MIRIPKKLKRYTGPERRRSSPTWVGRVMKRGPKNEVVPIGSRGRIPSDGRPKKLLPKGYPKVIKGFFNLKKKAGGRKPFGKMSFGIDIPIFADRRRKPHKYKPKEA